MSANKYSIAEQVHREVNFNVNYVSDDENYGTPEYWTEAIKSGDCEDYALAKRAKLLSIGWKEEDIAICICITETGDGHGVLLVDTDKGGFILDNRYEWPMVPSSLPYKWISILRGGKWYELSGWH